MAFPDDALGEDERVVLHGRPHWRLCLGPVCALLLVSAAAGFAAAVVRLQTWAPWAWALLGVLAGLAVTRTTVLPLVRWRCSHLAVTNLRFIVREGITTRNGLDVPIDRIDAVRVRSSTLERVLGCGTLQLDVAGERLRFAHVPAVERVQARLHREIGRIESTRRAAAGETQRTSLRGHADAAVRERMGA
ncbi:MULTISPECIES: PH domain-containing protein [Pseudonocardia]|uniref:Bacterial membrane flanked domain protein n=2 Tax=Pseudonocardia TaxID=1847 RepID=A0A1Y2MSW0_PSEAH|nr:MULTISPECIES: PH domain-containing protein [Pseudonocardia]OSY37598.1 Bacterial membrane flanked domain protein [Pseudonocardia autotrophica]TDN73720.1 membrane protein YdbS with pleckstrin-like domain [Pseudonocardia autotrophica]BBG04463.1 membrane protein [Pseudonocardia autotrophica]GEC27291.1 membrane protein [Pseudonocardia saturnea]